MEDLSNLSPIELAKRVPERLNIQSIGRLLDDVIIRVNWAVAWVAIHGIRVWLEDERVLTLWYNPETNMFDIDTQTWEKV